MILAYVAAEFVKTASRFLETKKKTTGFQDFPRVWWVPNPSKWAEKSWSIFKDKKKDQLDQRIQLCRDGSMT